MYLFLLCVLRLSNEEAATVRPATTISEEPWSPHNYTNVDFAQANAQGQATSKPKKIKSSRTRYVFSFAILLFHFMNLTAMFHGGWSGA